MFLPAKPSMSARDDHQLTVMTSVRPSPRSAVHIWAPRLPGVFPYALSPVLVMYSA
jgi:hypothetical protein